MMARIASKKSIHKEAEYMTADHLWPNFLKTLIKNEELCWVLLAGPYMTIQAL